MDSGLWWSIGLSVPVSIGSGLAVPYIERWFDQQGRVRSEKERRAIRKRYIRILRLRANPPQLTNELIIDGVFAGLWGMLILLGTLLYAIGFVVQVSHPSAELFYERHAIWLQTELIAFDTTGMIIMFFGAFRMMRKVINMTDTYHAVTAFDIYEKRVPPDIKQEVAERLK